MSGDALFRKSTYSCEWNFSSSWIDARCGRCHRHNPQRVSISPPPGKPARQTLCCGVKGSKSGPVSSFIVITNAGRWGKGGETHVGLHLAEEAVAQDEMVREFKAVGLHGVARPIVVVPHIPCARTTRRT
jgi:hypothetical protein